MSSSEYWVEIDEFPVYLVSNYGRVMNGATNQVLKPARSSNGYLCVNLVSHIKTVHRLVALAFLGCDDVGLDVNHIDGNKDNNSMWNLEWCTRAQNIRHAYQNGLTPVSGRRNVRPIKVMETGEIFESIAACARGIGGSSTCILKLLNGDGKTHMGYSFQYADD